MRTKRNLTVDELAQKMGRNIEGVKRVGRNNKRRRRKKTDFGGIMF